MYKLFFTLILLLSFNLFGANENIKQIENYLNNFTFFSADFIQVESEQIQEGRFYLGKDRIKIEYLSPTKISFILGKNKAMYYNLELDELQYFDPKGSPAEILYDIFFKKDLMNGMLLQEKKGSFQISKEIIDDDRIIKLIINLEKNPTNLRKIEIITPEEEISIGIFNYNLNPFFSNKFFSMATPRN